MLYEINMKGMQKTCVLAVRDDEPSMGDNKDTSSEAAGRWACRWLVLDLSCGRS